MQCTVTNYEHYLVLLFPHRLARVDSSSLSFVGLSPPGQDFLAEGTRFRFGFGHLVRLVATEGCGFVLVQRPQNGLSKILAVLLCAGHILLEAPGAVLFPVFTAAVLVNVVDDSLGLLPEVVKVFLLVPEALPGEGCGGWNVNDLWVFEERATLHGRRRRRCGVGVG